MAAQRTEYWKESLVTKDLLQHSLSTPSHISHQQLLLNLNSNFGLSLASIALKTGVAIKKLELLIEGKPSAMTFFEYRRLLGFYCCMHRARRLET